MIEENKVESMISGKKSPNHVSSTTKMKKKEEGKEKQFSVFIFEVSQFRWLSFSEWPMAIINFERFGSNKYEVLVYFFFILIIKDSKLELFIYFC